MKNKKDLALVSLFVLLSIFDLVMTLAVTVTPETCEESNPLAAMVMSQSGNFGTIIFKLLIVGLVVVCIGKVSTRRPVVARCVLVFAVILLSVVAIYHVYIACFFEDESRQLENLNKPNTEWLEQQESLSC
ncbi:MAG: hypothetical protein GY880_29895 [Planctomycetaceae bacterium]|nr:hypothetical protein [Planctomycetaceae bacterium]